MTAKPNIVYILADDMGYGDISSLNAESKIRTKHIDRLAETGMVFEDAHATSAVCTPSRYSILTGRYNWRTPLKQSVLFGESERLIEPERQTVADLFKSQGYATGCVGKWHLGWHWPRKNDGSDEIDYEKPITDGPRAVGFDYYFGIAASLDMPPHVYVENERVTAAPNRITKNSNKMPFWREGPTGADFEHEQVLPKLTEKACDFINNHADEPFFLYFPLTAPHTPILPTAEYQGKSGTNEYGDFCLMVDDCVGRVLDLLESKGIAENTIVIFTSDNGCSPKVDFEQLAALGHKPSYHFRGHKADIYEGGHRVPLLISWPERIPAGTREADQTVCLVDLMATCFDILDLTMPDNVGEDSVSNLPIWEGNAPAQPAREATVHHSWNGSFAIRQGRWKLEMCPGSGGWSEPKPGKEPPDAPPIQLYDLDADVGERTNVQNRHPDEVAKLTELLTRYVLDGRSTPGAPQSNTGAPTWPQLTWIYK